MADGVATLLQQLIGAGSTPGSIALFLELLISDRGERVDPEEVLDFVWTGPETAAAPSRDTNAVVGELFSSATDSVLVAGYAVYQGREVFSALAKRMEELDDLKVDMYLNVQRKYGDTTAEEAILEEFTSRFKNKEWPGTRIPKVYYDPRSLDLDYEKRASLHAKCIVVDRKVSFVSSANFTKAAQVKNIEAGVLIRSSHFSEHLARHFEALADAGVLRLLRGI